MLNPVLNPAAYTYFENSVGRLLEYPTGHYIAVEYYHGPRQLSELHAFLTHAGQLLASRGWDKLLGDQCLMAAFTPEETAWLTNFWCAKAQQCTDLYGALLLPHDVFARLSWKGGQVGLPAPAQVPA